MRGGRRLAERLNHKELKEHEGRKNQDAPRPRQARALQEGTRWIVHPVFVSFVGFVVNLFLVPLITGRQGGA